MKCVSSDRADIKPQDTQTRCIFIFISALRPDDHFHILLGLLHFIPYLHESMLFDRLSTSSTPFNKDEAILVLLTSPFKSWWRAWWWAASFSYSLSSSGVRESLGGVKDARKNPVFIQANYRASLTGYYSYWIDWIEWDQCWVLRNWGNSESHSF